MKVTVWYRDGDIRTVDLVGPLRIDEKDSGMNTLYDEGGGVAYYFNKDGSFDGTGIFTAANDITDDEAHGIMQGLKEMHEGKTKPFAQIQEELEGKKRLN